MGRVGEKESTHDCDDHAPHTLVLHPECCEEQENDGDGDGRDGEHHFVRGRLGDGNKKHDGESEEEEKVKLEQGNVDLDSHISVSL